MAVDQAIRFLENDTAGGRVRKLTTEAEQTEKRLLRLQTQINDLLAAKCPVMYREKDGRIQLDGLPSRAGVLQRDRTGAVRVTQELQVGEWFEYGNRSTIIGWTTFTQASIFYCKIGTVFFCRFCIAGESDNVLTSFTIPYNCRDGITQQSVLVMDAGAWDPWSGIMQLAAGTNVVALFRATFAAWTAQDIKQTHGEFWCRLEI